MKPYRHVLSSAQRKLSIEIEQIRSSVLHAGEVGTLIEHRIRSALETVLPEKIGVSNGFVTDSTGQISRQMDIVLYDKMNTPRILAGDGAQIFPVESTYACGEIKTKLDARSFNDVFKKCKSYKSLTRRAYVRHTASQKNTFSLFGKQHEQWQSFFFCIAVKSVKEKTLLRIYQDTHVRNLTPQELSDGRSFMNRVDAVFSLSGPSVVNSSKPVIAGRPQEQSIDLLPTEESRFCVYPAKEPWALFVYLLLRYMTQAPQVLVNMIEYDNGESF